MLSAQLIMLGDVVVDARISTPCRYFALQKYDETVRVAHVNLLRVLRCLTRMHMSIRICAARAAHPGSLVLCANLVPQWFQTGQSCAQCDSVL